MRNTIGIVTVHWNSLPETLNLLSCIKQSTNVKWQLVVVNNSPEHLEVLTKTMAEKMYIINNSENVGYPKALNQGLVYLEDEFDMDYYLILNNDLEFSRDFLSKLVTNKDTNTIYSPVILHKGTDKIESTGGDVNLFLGGTVNCNKGKRLEDANRADPDFLSGACMFFHKEVLDQLAGFDESYFAYYEDVDFSYRAREQNIQLVVLWGVNVWHSGSASTKKDSWLKHYLLARNEIVFARKHLRGFQKWIFIVSSLVRQTCVGVILFDKYRIRGSIAGLKSRS